MYPHAGQSPVSTQVVGQCGAVFDAVYNPGETELLRLAKEAGAVAVGGMEMLVYQAVAAHEIWYGSKFRPEDLEALCRRPRPRRSDFLDEGREELAGNIILCGFMGSGKTSVGRRLAKLLDREFYDWTGSWKSGRG